MHCDVARRYLHVPGQVLPLPPLSASWRRAAHAHGFVVVSLTRMPLSAPSLPVIEGMLARLRRGQMWLGFAGLGVG